MSNVSQTKAAVNAARAVPTDDSVREIIGKTVVEFNLATDALHALTDLLRFAEADEANRFMYSPECIAVMVAAMAEAIDKSFDPLRGLHAEFLIAGGKHHE